MKLWTIICAVLLPWRTFRRWQTNKIVYRWHANRTVSIDDEAWFAKVGIHYADDRQIREIIEIAARKSVNSVLQLIKAALARGIVFSRYQLDAWFEKTKIDQGDHMQSRLNLAYLLYGTQIPLCVFEECIRDAVESQLLRTKDYEAPGLAPGEPPFAVIWREQCDERQLHIAECAAKKGFFLLLKEMYERIGNFNKKMPQEIALACLKAKWSSSGITGDGELLLQIAELVNLSHSHKTYGREVIQEILAVDPRKFTEAIWDALKLLAVPLLLEGAVNFPEPVERCDAKPTAVSASPHPRI